MESFPQDQSSALHQEDKIYTTYPVSSKQEKPASLIGPVAQALSRSLRVSLQDIILQENSEKYRESATDNLAEQDALLREVFEIMWRLNEAALQDHRIGTLPGRDVSFRSALQMSLLDIARSCRGRPLQYVELGPEPAKTCFILEGLHALGITIHSYTGVDINPQSAPVMREALSRVLREDQILHRTALFEDFRVDAIRKPGCRALVTMLGWQEGNDDPYIMSSWLENMTQAGDLLLSEAQVFDRERQGNIMEFYDGPLMRRFSRIAFERRFGARASSYGTWLIPVRLSDGRREMALVIGERFVQDGRPKLLVTNFCTKFTAKSLRLYRETALFRVIEERFTADRTILFQLSARV